MRIDGALQQGERRLCLAAVSEVPGEKVGDFRIVISGKKQRSCATVVAEQDLLRNGEMAKEKSEIEKAKQRKEPSF